jgi:hypothetical protein
MNTKKLLTFFFILLLAFTITTITNLVGERWSMKPQIPRQCASGTSDDMHFCKAMQVAKSNLNEAEWLCNLIKDRNLKSICLKEIKNRTK